MTKQKAQNWWLQRDTQEATVKIMEVFSSIQIMVSDFTDGEIVVKVVTFDGKPIDGFPSDIMGKRVIMGGFEIM